MSKIQSILIRKIPDEVVCSIEKKAQLAKKSREEYIREILINFSETDSLKGQRREYEELCRELAEVIKQNTFFMDQLKKALKGEQTIE